MEGLLATLRMLATLARGQTKDKAAEIAYKAAYGRGEDARKSETWVDDEVAEFIIDNADDFRQGLIDGLRGAPNRYDGADEPQDA